MRLVLLVFACVIVAGCEKPIEEAQVGETVQFIHLVDAVTGKCVVLTAGDNAILTVEPQDACRQLPNERVSR